MDGVVTLNKREQKRLMVLNKVNSREIKVEEAATIISLSMRQTWRLLAAAPSFRYAASNLHVCLMAIGGESLLMLSRKT